MSQRLHRHGPQGHSAAACTSDARAYLPRNVVNAPEIKSAITSRSAKRQDDPQVREWLENHFFRWLIGSFNRAVPIASVEHCADCMGGMSAVPAWFIQRSANRDAGGPPEMFYIDPAHPQLLDKERVLLEFLNARRGTRLAEKLQRINCTMALALWEKEHARLQARRGKGWVHSSGQALLERLRTPNGAVFEIMGDSPQLREEMAYESYHMRHCLGQFADRKRLTGGYGEHYARAAQAGRLRLFSLRGPGNMPHVTVSLHVLDNGVQIDQVKGKQNRPPIRKYADDVLQLLRWLVPHGERHPDCDSMGLVHEPAPDGRSGQWKFVTDIERTDFLLNVMTVNFHLIEHFETPPAALQWLMLSMAPGQLCQARQLDEAVSTAAWIGAPANASSGAAGEADAPSLFTPLSEIDGLPLPRNERGRARLFGA